jgi:hypothetical protein
MKATLRQSTVGQFLPLIDDIEDREVKPRKSSSRAKDIVGSQAS